MKKSMTSFLCISLLATLALSSCNKENTEVKEKRIKDGATIDWGPAIPEIRDIRNDTVSVALYPSAQLFFIDLGLVQGDNSITSIKQANKLDIPVRAKLYEDSYLEIAEIYPATEEDVKKYRESQREWNK